MKTIRVFLGSSTGKDPVYSEATATLGRELAKRGISCIYDGLFEVYPLRQLGFHSKPCGLLDVNGFYQPKSAS